MTELFIGKLKMNLRLSGTVFDEHEVKPIAEACFAELKRRGIVKLDEEDPLIFRAAVYYGKANFGFDKDSEKYDKAFDKLADAMALSEDYCTEGDINV